MPAIKKKKIIIKIVLGYFVALSLMLGIAFFSLNRLNKIEKTVDDITNNLAATKALSHTITSKIRLVRLSAERYKRFYRQGDIDQFNEKIIELKGGLTTIRNQVKTPKWQEMIQYIEQETAFYEKHFEKIATLIMYQQSLLSTVFIKQELLIENQLSAIRINVGIIQKPSIFFSFGNARNSFQLMRLYQSKYISEADERYFVMFKNNYRYASKAFSELNSALAEIPKSSHIKTSANKANEALQIYFETFLKIRSASILLKKSTRNLDQHELEITATASKIASEIENEYQVQNKLMQSLVLRTQVELIVAMCIAIALSIGLIFVVSRKIATPIFTELQEKADKLELLAKSDGLTGIANRRLLDERLASEWQRLKRDQAPLSIIMADVDQFKAYNDHYGHQKGDDCLITVAQALNSCIKRPNDLVGRYGGEEFMILLPNTDTIGAIDVAENIKKHFTTIAIEHLQSDVAAHLTLSFGVASNIPCKDSSPENLVLRADKALYQAKKTRT